MTKYCKACFAALTGSGPKGHGTPGTCDHCEQHRVCFGADDG